MDLNLEAQAFKDILASLKQNEDILIFLPETATRDAMAAALSLMLSLQTEPLKKTVRVAYPKQPTVAWSHLVGINKVIQQVGNKNFIISLDYIEGSIERVTYNIEGDKFNLVVEPKPGAPKFDENKVRYSYSGANAGLVIALNASTPQQLGKHHSENQGLFAQKPVLVVDHNPQNSQYGKVNVVRPTAGVSELITHLIQAAQLPMTSDIATNLYDGLLSGSRNFSVPAVSASTFEAAAILLKQNARKPGSHLTRSEELPHGEFAGSNEGEKQLPPDWLKPKIYKGSSGLL